MSILFLGFSGVSFVGNFLLIRDLEVKTKRLVDAPSSLGAANSLRESIVASQAPRAVLNMPFMDKSRMRATDRATATFLEIMDRENVGPAKARIAEVVRRAGTDAFDALAVLAMDLGWLTNRARSDSSLRPDLAQFSPFSTSERDRAEFDAVYDAFIAWSSDDALDQIIEDERASFSLWLDKSWICGDSRNGVSVMANSSRRYVILILIGMAGPEWVALRWPALHPSGLGKVWSVIC
ncbi:MAG: hypothetical protein IPK00_10510 [Deltaproteobacteria bacterium]|nr:hypothetical protein [Deltaproteobacteria bacterium]